ncbi:hypothetical protein NM208_g1419 [Fusarium decemcellulare]|uniref:Uncharacterized protein n=1 Tax=Fusarium decemcellulare TaxID=57161 RepID=A0ACC1SW83_9HYPO|nr:hypothetical protein NM208_g1419 [Fusarium decemcellulare]
MGPLYNLAVPKGSTVLVTGANGLLGSHIADQFLEYGYKVRGTVRDVDKNSWLSTVFDKKYGKGVFELFEVSDMASQGAFIEAVKGASIMVHSATVMSFEFDPHKVIPPAVDGALNALVAACAEPTVQRFVFTSSAMAANTSHPGTPGIKVTDESWNEDAITKAWAGPPYTIERANDVYAASKALAEQEVWKYYRKHQNERPDLVINTVLPNYNIGRLIDPIHQGFRSSSIMPVLLWKGQVTDLHRTLPRQYSVDYQDTARLHLAAGIFEHVQGERIFGFAHSFCWDMVLELLREIEPEKAFPPNFSSEQDPNEIEPRDKAEQLLRDLGRPGWTSLEESVRGVVGDLYVVEKAIHQ